MSYRILVTGATGFIGRRLVEAFASTGKTIRAATRHTRNVYFPLGVEITTVPDFHQPFDWQPLLAGVDAVVHLAGVAHVGAKCGPTAYERVNHLATANLATACARVGVGRFVFLSSIRAQSGAAAAYVLKESDPPHPTEDYGRSKLHAEEAVRSTSVPWTILRPAVVYGPGAKGNLANLVRIASSRWPLPFAAFTNKRSLLGLDNLISAIEFTLTESATVRETFLVADPIPLPFAEIVAALRLGEGRSPDLLAVPPVVFETGLKLLGRGDVWERLGGNLVVDVGKLMAKGWRPNGDTKAGLARMARAMIAWGDPTSPAAS